MELMMDSHSTRTINVASRRATTIFCATGIESVERARGLPGFTQYQSHVLHIRHIDTRLPIDHVAAKLLHGALQLAANLQFVH